MVAKVERIDTAQLQLEFAAKLAVLDALGGQPAPMPDDDPADKPARGKGMHRLAGAAPRLPTATRSPLPVRVHRAITVGRQVECYWPPHTRRR